jgi:inner membrane protein
MPTILTHAISAVALGSGFPRRSGTAWILLAGALCAALPDVDVIGFRFGVRYGDLLGHRGLTHSLAFAAVLAAFLVAVLFRAAARGWSRKALWLYFFVATASHGILDALTDGGLGVAFFSPFSNARYFFPVHPIQASPIGIEAFMSDGGLAVLSSEALWTWVPSVLLVGALFARRSRSPDHLTTIPKSPPAISAATSTRIAGSARPPGDAR